MRKYTRRPLPTLITVQIPEFKQRHRATRLRNHCSTEPEDVYVYKSAILNGSDSLRALIELVLSFLEDGPDYVTGTTKWLKQLKDALDSLEEALASGYLGGDVTIETEGVSDLDAILDCVPEVEANFDEGPDPFASKLLSFWQDEVKRRGWELINTCTLSLDVLAAAKRTLQPR